VHYAQALVFEVIISVMYLGFLCLSKLFNSPSLIHLFAFAKISFVSIVIHSTLLVAISYFTFLIFTFHFVQALFLFNEFIHFLCLTLRFLTLCISYEDLLLLLLYLLILHAFFISYTGKHYLISIILAFLDLFHS
jgi:hypothetical protein